MTFDEILNCLPKTEQTIIRGMINLLEDIDHQTEIFAKQTGLKCKNGCGTCCTTPIIETTVAEVLPLAVTLWSQGNALKKLDEIRLNTSKGLCVFYEPNPMDQSLGRCSIYANRPGLCRLFGYAARQDKFGHPKLITCKIIKENQPQACQQTEEKLHQGVLKAPLLSAHTFSVSSIDPIHGQELRPINQAIGMAIEKIGYYIQDQVLNRVEN